MNPALLKLGKLPTRHDPRNLHLSAVLATDLPPAPAWVDWSTKVTTWGMMGNDTLGDCTCAAAGHMIECWTSLATTELFIGDQPIISAYSAITGYTPSDPSTDQGAVELDVLKYWRKTGIAGHKILAFAKLEPGNLDHVKQSVYLFGGTYIGVQLPLSAQSQDIWDVPAEGLTGDGEPGSWGGHAICVVAYNSTGLWVVTWGKLQFMTWAFWKAYCDEAYAVFSTDMLVNGKAPDGFDQSALDKYLAEVGTMEASPVPPPPTPPADPIDLLIVIFTGLFTNPVSNPDSSPYDNDCGMLDLADRIVASLPQDATTKIVAFGWDENPQSPYTNSPDGLCRYIKDTITKYSAKRIVALRHSFGGALGVFFDQWLWNWYSGPAKDSPPFKFDQVIMFDPVPNAVRFGQGQNPGWYLPLTVSPSQLCFYQRAGLLMDIKGEPLDAQPGVTNVDVTGWTNPQLGHIDFFSLTGIINDSRVQSQVLAATSGVSA